MDFDWLSFLNVGLISPVAPTVAPTQVPSSAPADLLESDFDAFGSVPVSTTTAASDNATAAPSGGFDASGEAIPLFEICVLSNNLWLI